MTDLMGDGWVQTLVQTGSLGLALLMFRGVLSSHRDTVRDLLTEFRQDRKDHNGKTDMVKQAIDGLRGDVKEQTLSFRMDIQQLQTAIATACKAGHHAEEAGS